MTNCKLVFIHGRAQEFKDAKDLKATWISAFERGLSKSDLSLPIPEGQIQFPYYGQTLHDLTNNKDAEDAADVIIRGGADDQELEEFAADYFGELKERFDLNQSKLREAGGDADVIKRGLPNWEWVQTILRGIDQFVPGASSASVAIFTNDVYQYLTNIGMQVDIDEGVQEAFDPTAKTVVVSHSLGTVVAYNILRKEADQKGWAIPLHVTLGSPLGVRAIRERLKPLKRPQAVSSWFNAMDEGDVVALYALTPSRFGVTPPIENKTDVENQTDNQHGITGYLDDKEVAQRIYDALVQD
ncbi:hypothetical protein ACFL1S_04045 [Pseudomonadota bacterium]